MRLAPAILTIFLTGCCLLALPSCSSGADIARSVLVGGAEALDTVDRLEAAEYVRAHVQALELAVTAEDYVARMAGHRHLDEAIRAARAALALGRAVVNAWDAGGSGRWAVVAGCIATTFAEVVRLSEAVGLDVPPELGSTLANVATLGAPFCEAGGE